GAKVRGGAEGAAPRLGPRHVRYPLPAQELMSSAFNHHGCHAQAARRSTRERKQRNPHGVPLLLRLNRLSSQETTPKPPIRSRNFAKKRYFNTIFVKSDLAQEGRATAAAPRRLLTLSNRCATIRAAVHKCFLLLWAAPPGFVVRVPHRSPDLKTGARAAPVTSV